MGERNLPSGTLAHPMGPPPLTDGRPAPSNQNRKAKRPTVQAERLNSPSSSLAHVTCGVRFIQRSWLTPPRQDGSEPVAGARTHQFVRGNHEDIVFAKSHILKDRPIHFGLAFWCFSREFCIAKPTGKGQSCQVPSSGPDSI